MNTTIFACTVLLTALVPVYRPQDEPPAGPPPDRPDAATLALFEYDQEGELELDERGFSSLTHGSRTDLSYASPMGGRVPAFLYQPEGEGPFAGVLLMHGMPGDRSNMGEVAREYVAAGAVVLAISAPWARGGRTPADILRFDERDRAEQIQLIQDLRRGLDVLLALGTVDPQRLGYVGGSYGGAMGGLLAGVEPRLRAVVLMVGDGGLVSHFTGEDDQGIAPEGLAEPRWQAWLAAMRPIEPIRFVGLAQAPLLFQNGKLDELVPAADARDFHAAAGENKTVIWYEGGHALTRRVVQDQARWLAPQLGLDLAGFGLEAP